MVCVGVVCISRLLKEELPWAIDEQVWVINKIIQLCHYR